MSYNFLIVDDSATTRTIIKKILSMSDIDVGELYEAENGKKALDVLSCSWVDLVFADINMPEMNGMEMIRKMSEDGLLSTIPVVVVSSDGNEARIEELMSKGIKVYLRKPFTPEIFREVTSTILGGGKYEHKI